jgi:hypothetical protein
MENEQLSVINRTSVGYVFYSHVTVLHFIQIIYWLKYKECAVIMMYWNCIVTLFIV